MRPPTERDQCKAKLDTLTEGFMRADWTAYRDAVAWLRDFADQKNIERGHVMRGGYWFTPQQIEALRDRARERATRAADLRPTLSNEGELSRASSLSSVRPGLVRRRRTARRQR
jgi:hypothetical protein